MYSCTRGTLGMSPAQLADALWGAVMATRGLGEFSFLTSGLLLGPLATFPGNPQHLNYP